MIAIVKICSTHAEVAVWTYLSNGTWFPLIVLTRAREQLVTFRGDCVQPRPDDTHVCVRVLQILVRIARVSSHWVVELTSNLLLVMKTISRVESTRMMHVCRAAFEYIAKCGTVRQRKLFKRLHAVRYALHGPDVAVILDKKQEKVDESNT